MDLSIGRGADSSMPSRRPRRSPRRRAHLWARGRRVLAALCLGLAAWLVVGALRPAPVEVGVPVLVVSRDVAAGERLVPGDVQVRDQPTETVPAGALTAPGDLPGTPLNGPLAAGEVLVGTRFLGEGTLRASGEQVLAHAVVTDPAVLAAARPGTRVDVVSTADGQVVAPAVLVAATDETGVFLLVPPRDVGPLTVAASGGLPGVGVTVVVLSSE